MEFKDWLNKTKTDKSDLSPFLDKIERLMIDNGFDSVHFEKLVNLKIEKIGKDVDTELNSESDAKN